MSRLRVEGLSKKFRSRQVVRDLSIEVASGEVVGLLGPNGAGKTTAFYMIVGLVPTDSGRIIIDDQDVSRLPVHRRARLGLGYLPQEASVFRKLTVECSKRCSTNCTSATSATASGRACRAASVDVSKSRAPLRRSRNSCCSTSRSRA
jgi:ABC-type lipopolysaccharide export system ATPase subunit